MPPKPSSNLNELLECDLAAVQTVPRVLLREDGVSGDLLEVASLEEGSSRR